MDEQLKALLLSIITIIKVHVLDEDVLAIHLETFARAIAKPFAFCLAAGYTARQIVQKLDNLITPITPKFNASN